MKQFVTGAIFLRADITKSETNENVTRPRIIDGKLLSLLLEKFIKKKGTIKVDL